MRNAVEGRVTRDVEPAALRDLLARPRRATVAFVHEGATDVLPVRVDAAAPDRWLFAVAAEAAPDLAGREVVLLVDDGRYWFELRGISVRGVAVAAESAEPGLAWYAVSPRRVLAWDYATVRVE